MKPLFGAKLEMLPLANPAGKLDTTLRQFGSFEGGSPPCFFASPEVSASCPGLPAGLPGGFRQV